MPRRDRAGTHRAASHYLMPTVARSSCRWETTNNNATGTLTIMTAAASSVYAL